MIEVLLERGLRSISLNEFEPGWIDLNLNLWLCVLKGFFLLEFGYHYLNRGSLKFWKFWRPKFFSIHKCDWMISN
jgi:hypothetical protein